MEEGSGFSETIFRKYQIKWRQIPGSRNLEGNICLYNEEFAAFYGLRNFVTVHNSLLYISFKRHKVYMPSTS
jgi:hypothetical protein